MIKKGKISKHQWELLRILQLFRAKIVLPSSVATVFENLKYFEPCGCSRRRGTFPAYCDDCRNDCLLRNHYRVCFRSETVKSCVSAQTQCVMALLRIMCGQRFGQISELKNPQVKQKDPATTEAINNDSLNFELFSSDGPTPLFTQDGIIQEYVNNAIILAAKARGN